MNNTIDCIGNKCTACRACENICPQKAISMCENEEGFLYPKIDYNKCISCGLCKNRCHILKDIDYENIKKIYAVKSKNQENALKSTSSGIAYILSEYVLENTGYIFGACFNEQFDLNHICVTTKDNLELLRGSKYVISDTNDTFKNVKEILNKDELVLYIGTACQIAGLKSFLNKEYNNLITIDIVCHGVPSQKLFKKYIKYLKDKFGEEIVEYHFRNKDKTLWGMGFTAKVATKTKTKYLKADLDPYYINFLKGNTYRESCYMCKYANINTRPGDFTIGDFWGIEKFKPEFYDKSGVSLCILNTKRAIGVFEKIKNNVILEEASEEEAIYFNGNLVHPTERPSIRDSIYKGIDDDLYIKKNMRVKINIKIILKNITPKFIKKIYKRFFKKNE